MTLHADLLEQANHLSRREPRRPKQASLRRAVSTAYYAVFHLITTEAVQTIGPNLSSSQRAVAQRWFNHGEMKKVCKNFIIPTFVGPSSLMAFQPSPQLKVVASNFVRLQEARHKADYDLAAGWTRLRAQQQVALAQDVLNAWSQIRATEEANLFILALLMWKKYEAERSA